MEKQFVCIVCPRGCNVSLSDENGKITLSGNACPRGEKYAIDEYSHPVRTLTSIVRVKNRKDTMLSVKTETPIAKECIFDAMEKIRAIEVSAPIKTGDIIISELFGSKLIATKTIN